MFPPSSLVPSSGAGLIGLSLRGPSHPPPRAVLFHPPTHRLLQSITRDAPSSQASTVVLVSMPRIRRIVVTCDLRGVHDPVAAVAFGDGETHCSKVRSDEVQDGPSCGAKPATGPCGFTSLEQERPSAFDLHFLVCAFSSTSFYFRSIVRAMVQESQKRICPRVSKKHCQK